MLWSVSHLIQQRHRVCFFVLFFCPLLFNVTQLSQNSIAEKLLVCLFDLLVYLLSFLSAHSTWQKKKSEIKKQANGVGLVVVEAETTPVSVEAPAQHHQPWPPLWRLWRTIPKIFLLLFSIDCQKVFSVVCVCVLFFERVSCACVQSAICRPRADTFPCQEVNTHGGERERKAIHAASKKKKRKRKKKKKKKKSQLVWSKDERSEWELRKSKK